MITKEMAINEVYGWLENEKHWRKSQLESQDIKPAIEYIAECITDGVLRIDENGTMTQKLSVEVCEVKELSFKPNLKALEYAVCDKHKPEQDEKRTISLIAVATGELESIINKLEGVDYNLAKNVISLYRV